MKGILLDMQKFKEMLKVEQNIESLKRNGAFILNVLKDDMKDNLININKTN